MNRWEYAGLILQELGISGLHHRGAQRALVAWMGPESSWYVPCDGIHPDGTFDILTGYSTHGGALWNPLNTTLVKKCSLAEPYRTDPDVQNYKSATCGTNAVVETLLNSPESWNYAPVVAALRRPFVRGVDVLHRVSESNWGTFKAIGVTGEPNPQYVEDIWKTYQNNRTRFNTVPIGVPSV